MNRKTFLRSACITGSCLCGFGSVSVAASNAHNSEETDLFKSWITSLLSNLSDDNHNKHSEGALKSASMSHYDYLKMDEMLGPYHGRLEDFNKFLEKTWGWKIQFDEQRNTLIADENKNYCVCPLIRQNSGKNTAILCNCSEGFAEKMFSSVVGHPVSARVVTSVLRGDESCRYEINM